MKVYWSGCQKTDPDGTLVNVKEKKLFPEEKEYNLLTNEELEEIFAAARGFIHDLTNGQHRYEYPTANDFLKRKENENKA